MCLHGSDCSLSLLSLPLTGPGRHAGLHSFHPQPAPAFRTMAKPSGNQLTNIADLHFDKANARRRTERSHDMLQKSLQEVGAARSIVIDEDDVILAGNGTVEVKPVLKLDVTQGDRPLKTK